MLFQKTTSGCISKSCQKNNRSKHRFFLTRIFKRIEFVLERSQHYIFPQRSSVRNIFFSESMFIYIYIYIYIIRRRTTTMDGRTMTTTTDGRTDDDDDGRTSAWNGRPTAWNGKPTAWATVQTIPERGVPCRGPAQRPRLGDTLRYPSAGWRH